MQNHLLKYVLLIKWQKWPRNATSNEIDVNGNNITEPDLRVDVESHACQLHNDILSQCLDNTGTYTCKEFSPRCYIIQKVIIIESKWFWDKYIFFVTYFIIHQSNLILLD